MNLAPARIHHVVNPIPNPYQSFICDIFYYDLLVWGPGIPTRTKKASVNR